MSEHKTIVQHDRARIVCTACPWFKHDAALTEAQLREWGRNHKRVAASQQNP